MIPKSWQTFRMSAYDQVNQAAADRPVRPDRTPEQIIRELWEDHMILRPQRAAAGATTVDLPNPI